MEIILLLTGKTSKNYIAEAESDFNSRLLRYCKFRSHCIELPKKYRTSDSQIIKREESKLILKFVAQGDLLVLLDENGKSFGSRAFAEWMEKQLVMSHKRIIFVVGGAYGFDSEVKKRANNQLSLSKMTFTHQLIRVIFMEQLYRAFTILRNEKYHND